MRPRERLAAGSGSKVKEPVVTSTVARMAVTRVAGAGGACTMGLVTRLASAQPTTASITSTNQSVFIWAQMEVHTTDARPSHKVSDKAATRRGTGGRDSSG